MKMNKSKINKKVGSNVTGAPLHTSKKTQSWFRENFFSFWDKEMWPPSSPDLNLLVFIVAEQK